MKWCHFQGNRTGDHNIEQNKLNPGRQISHILSYMGPGLYIDCKSVLYGSMCIYTVTKQKWATWGVGWVWQHAWHSWMKTYLSVRSTTVYNECTSIWTLERKLHRTKAVFTPLAVFDLQHFPNLSSELFSVCSHGSSALAAMRALHVSVHAALSSIWRVQQFCRCSSLLLVLVLTLQMAFCLSVYRPIILEYQVWCLGQGNHCRQAFRTRGGMWKTRFRVLQLGLTLMSLFPWTVNFKNPSHPQPLAWGKVPWRNSTWVFFFSWVEG